MKLSKLKTGEKGIIVKVLGHGGFRKRIIEMGFIKGKEVEVLQNAPLQDPVIYKLMGYEVSLRHQEADMIEIVSADTPIEATQFVLSDSDRIHEDDYVRHEAMKERRTINVALVGNPNCGKTSLFNFASGAHGHVGNAVFNLMTVVDMQVTGRLAGALVYLDDGSEEFFHTLAALKRSGYHRHTEKTTECVEIEMVATTLEFVVHVQGADHADVHVDKLGGEVEIALDVGGIDHVDDHVGHLFCEMFTHIELFW